MGSSGVQDLLESLRQGLSGKNLEKLQELAFATAVRESDLTVVCTVLGLAFEVWWDRWHDEPLSSQQIEKIEDRVLPAAKRALQEPNAPEALSDLARVVLWTIESDQDPVADI